MQKGTSQLYIPCNVVWVFDDSGTAGLIFDFCHFQRITAVIKAQQRNILVAIKILKYKQLFWVNIKTKELLQNLWNLLQPKRSSTDYHSDSEI